MKEKQRREGTKEKKRGIGTETRKKDDTKGCREGRGILMKRD